MAAEGPWFPAAWFPDGTRLLASSITPTITTAWTISLIGGSTAQLREGALVQSVSPDGSLIAFTTEIVPPHAKNDIWVMDSRGGKVRKIVASDGRTGFGSVRWAPDSKRIAYQKWQSTWPRPVVYSIETRELNGGAASTVVSNAVAAYGENLPVNYAGDFAWLRDERVIYTVSGTAADSRTGEIWQISVDPSTGKPRGAPQRIANLAFHIWGFSLSADGMKLVCESASDLSRILVGRFGAGGKTDRSAAAYKHRSLERPLRLDARRQVDNFHLRPRRQVLDLQAGAGSSRARAHSDGA